MTDRNQSFVKSTPPSTQEPSQHALTLKVMRIKKATNNIIMPVLLEKSDFLGHNSYNQKTLFPERSIYSDKPGIVMDSFGFQESWSLPEKFGDIYTGEQLSVYFAIHNESYNPAKNVVLKVEMVTNSTRTAIFDLAQAPLPKIDSNSYQDFVIEHPLNEPENHLLACAVTYTIEENGVSETKTLKNVYKFLVSNAVVIKNIKITPVKSLAYLSFDLFNMVDGSLFIESVKFDSHISFDVVDHSCHNKGEDYDHPFAKGEARRYLFELKPKDVLVKGPQTLGKVVISWRSSVNQSGQVVSAIQQKPVAKPEVEMEFVSTEHRVACEKPFAVKCIVHNRTAQKLDLIVTLDTDKLFPLCIHGSSIKKVGLVEANSSKEVLLDLWAMGIGLHKIGNGIYLKDIATNRVYSCQNLGSVLIK